MGDGGSADRAMHLPEARQGNLRDEHSGDDLARQPLLERVDDELSAELTTSLPDGDYCDVLATQDCAVSTVADGTISVTVPPMSAQA